MGKAKKALATTLATMLSLTALIGATACDPTGTPGTGGGAEATTTVINVGNFGGGFGRAWLDQAAQRFAALKVNEEYTPGKKGVSFEVTSTTGIKPVNMASQGYHMFFAQAKYSQYFEEIQKGDVMDITDIVTAPLTEYGEESTIEDKIPEEFLFALKGNDGKYYMLPHYESHAAPSYDVDLFTKDGLYLAKAGEGTEYKTDLIPGQTYYFTGKASEKTVGNDGIAGTDDDGMPTTLNELVAMCDYMKTRKRINPFSAPGGHIDYANYLIEGLWAGLAGYEQRMAVASHKGTVDYVTGVNKDQELWPGSGIYAPVIETTTLVGDSTDGYKAINQAGRYYAFAFMELCYKQGWFYERYKEGNYNHKEAMRTFLLNGLGNYPKIAAHVEGSYWYNEAEGYGLFNEYKVHCGVPGVQYKNIALWHMPTSVGNDVVTGVDNKREEPSIDNMTSMMMINGNLDDVAGNEGLIRACKEFFQFLSTEQELQNFTKVTGCAKALYDYDINDSVLSELDPYQQTIMRLRANNSVVYQYGDNATYRAKSAQFSYSALGDGYKPNFNGVDYVCVLDVYYKTNAAGNYKNAWDCFVETGFSESKWKQEIYAANNRT